MEERYHLRGKLGQGGMGLVYRAYDKRMNREVAVKRLVDDVDPEQQKEATDQLQKEAGSLASLQHPNIVTIYDVDRDEDGPYVVMELIVGKTLDEIVEDAPLTLADFKDFALQVQEGLIAAQDLGLVHRDLKPGNLMLNWLPSGKFQAKIVDFGLAKLMPKPTFETLGPNDSIFGSIYFMAPEQFERAAIDGRVDMYSIGCVYYHALTGNYPFTGPTAPEVMAAHLNHIVIPLQEIRPDLPLWICDWIMWHMNRYPADRPENARESLRVFLQNENAPPPPPPKEKPHAPGPPGPKRPDGRPHPAVRIQTSPVEVNQPKTQSAPKALVPPDGFKPSVHTSAIYLGDIPPPAAPTAAAVPAPPSPTARVAPAKPMPASPVPTARMGVNPAARSGPVPHPAGQRTTFVVPPPKPKKKMKKSEQTALFIALVLILGFVGFLIYHFAQ